MSKMIALMTMYILPNYKWQRLRTAYKWIDEKGIADAPGADEWFTYFSN